jgi:hypothetical protein
METYELPLPRDINPATSAANAATGWTIENRGNRVWIKTASTLHPDDALDFAAHIVAFALYAADGPPFEVVQRIAARVHGEICRGTPDWEHASACDCAAYTRAVLRAHRDGRDSQ